MHKKTSTMFGNILAILTLISYGLLGSLSLKPMPSGDYSVGYAFAWMLCLGGFLLFSGLLFWNMYLNHSFDWLPAPFSIHFKLTHFLAWLVFVVAVIWALDYHSKWVPGEFPIYIRWLALSKVAYWMPVLVFIPVLYLINAEPPGNFPPNWIKITLSFGFSTCLLIGMGIFYGVGKAKVKQQVAINEVAKTKTDTGDWAFDTSMDQINDYNEPTIRTLLTYTHREKNERLRKAAAAKIKTYSDWEAQLIKILEEGELPERYWVYAYMDGNEIAHPDSFIQPMINSIERLLPEIKTSLKDPNSLYLAYVNVAALCRVLDSHFKDKAPDFRPGMEELQQVFAPNPPARIDKTAQKWFDEMMAESRLALENWLG